jgi:hypothetical protein
MKETLKDKIKKFCSWGIWNSDMVATAVAKGVISQAEADEILGNE